MRLASTLAAAALLSGLLTAPAAAQDSAQGRLRVFIDCQQAFCDQTFFKTGLTWIDNVRTPEDAQVHVLVSSRRAAAAVTRTPWCSSAGDNSPGGRTP